MTRKKRYGQKGPEPKGMATQNRVLEIVLKSDVAGTLEAVRASITYINVPSVEIKIIQGGVGPVLKSDLLMARTGSRLIVGFNVDLAPQIQKEAIENGIEVRLYDVIYKLSKDLTGVAKRMIPVDPEEKITGKAEVIAVFKRNRGIIIGCEVTAGIIEKGKRFRVITAMGPAYSGKIESLQIEKNPVKSGKIGQQVGIGISDWKKAKVGDLMECYDSLDAGSGNLWQPNPGVFYSKT
jgi:translation initiation factor IF-2